MQEQTGKMMDMARVQTEAEDSNQSLEAFIQEQGLTPLTKEEHDEMIILPEILRPGNLCWRRYKYKEDLRELSQMDTYLDGFERAKELYQK